MPQYQTAERLTFFHTKATTLESRTAEDQTMAERARLKRQRQAELRVDDLLVSARMMWRLDPSKPRSTGTEDRDFREYFGTHVLNVLYLWELIVGLDMVPDGGSHHNLLWALHYMKAYPKTRAMCSTCGGVDPKTMRKWVWEFITAIAGLEEILVSPRIVFAPSLLVIVCVICTTTSELTSGLLFVDFSCQDLLGEETCRGHRK